MRNSFNLACVVLLLLLGISVGFGWGTATHVYFADHLGVKFGPLNQNEIYGATLPDLFGYDFSLTGFTADYSLHTAPDLYWGLYRLATSRYAKAAFYGMFTHNNIDDKVRGADWYAHGRYPEPGSSPDPNGWIIQQGFILVGNPKIATYVNEQLGRFNLPDGTPVPRVFLPVVGHTLVETAVDILVKRNEDPLAGVRLFLAANCRSDEVPHVLSRVFSNIPISNFPSSEYVLAAETEYRKQMIGYGQLFLLPESQLITELSKQTIGVAQLFLVKVLNMSIDDVPQFDPNKISEFIRIAIRQVEPLYHKELMATLSNVEKNMLRYGPPPAGPVFAFWKEGSTENNLADFNSPTESLNDFTLDQNYPNPFNPTTNIAYAVPADSRVTLKVYNGLGQEIATLVDENMTAGRHVARWNANGVASGTYFYRMQAGSIVLTKSMVLVR